MIAESTAPLTRRRLRSPRAAGLAGIIFSLLLAASLILIQLSVPSAATYEGGWLADKSGRVRLAITLVPFAAVAFLWFIGVVRDQLGELEDQFFSSIFFGSGLLFLGALFVWMAVISAILTSYAANPLTFVDGGAYVFGRTLMNDLGGVVALRMAGVFMFSSGTIWLRTVLMPRWLVWLTYVMALVLLLGGGANRPLRLGFPIWVFVVSLFILRASGQQSDDEGRRTDDGRRGTDDD